MWFKIYFVLNVYSMDYPERLTMLRLFGKRKAIIQTTALYWASRFRLNEIIQLLLKNGANINA